ncbi:uncharacterized protein HD556DRAFT_1503401 [Suillus plorans]|uniref:Uncharacterized protein n=1 Tax=Suillus plorans TaxID=116603 RepID=A0A9P7ADH9_9AGAM|nr:uncharacterized protein HD556DRAFT_1503401 [Suillus plorans]KAG1787254.1 hypothetical protein HD556DRAFT_1503401 [Suillus plorans]
MPIKHIANPLVRATIFVYCAGILVMIAVMNSLGSGLSRARAIGVMVSTWCLALTLSLIRMTRTEVADRQGRPVGPVQFLSYFFTFFWGIYFDPWSDESISAGLFAGVSRHTVILLGHPIFTFSIGFFADLNLQIRPLIGLEGDPVSTACYL